MDTKLPPAITQRVCKTIVCAVAITVVGLIWGIASHDAIVVGLTSAIAVAGGIKLGSSIERQRLIIMKRQMGL